MLFYELEFCYLQDVIFPQYVVHVVRKEVSAIFGFDWARYAIDLCYFCKKTKEQR